MTDRLCAYEPCSKPLVPREGEKPSQLARRTCCNASCANRRAKNSTLTDLPTTKICEECGAVVHRPAGEAAHRWARHRFCNRLCASRNTIRTAANAPRPGSTVERPTCALDGCEERTTKRGQKFHSRTCAGLNRRNANGDARRAGRQRELERKQTGAPKKRTPRKPEPPLDMAALRPGPAALIPDPDVIDMDRKRAEADRMLDEGTTPHRIAHLLRVSVAQVNRWDRGDR